MREHEINLETNSVTDTGISNENHSLSPQDSEPLTLSSVAHQWKRITAQFRAEFGESSYQKWLAHSFVAHLKGQEVSIGLNNEKACDYVGKNYSTRLLRLWQNENAAIKALSFTAKAKAPALDSTAEGAAISSLSVSESRLSRRAHLNDNMTFANFVVGKSNELAFEAAKAIASGCNNYSPLYIHGEFGLGKTHLLHAICHSTSLRYLLLSADMFIKLYVNSVKSREDGEFDALFDNIDLLLIDDIHVIAGKKGSQNELYNIIGRLRDEGCRIVVASWRAPERMENIHSGLASRLSGGLTTEITAMDGDTAIAFVRTKIDNWGLQIPNDVLTYIGENFPTDKRELEGCLRTLQASTELLKRPITREIIDPILKNMNGKNSHGQPTIRSIQDAVCAEWDITLAEMKSPRRHKRIVLPRQIAMYLCKSLTARSLPEIAAKFGGRDHTTVLHSCKKIENLIKNDINLRAAVEKLQRQLTQ